MKFFKKRSLLLILLINISFAQEDAAEYKIELIIFKYMDFETNETFNTKLKVPNKVASFVLPLGITINMDGTALFQAVAAVFIAQIYGVPLSITSLFIIIFIAILSSVGAAAVPSAGIITLAMILTAIGVPLEGTAIIFGIDRILDMLRTTVNLWGNTSAALVVTKWVGEDAYEN